MNVNRDDRLPRDYDARRGESIVLMISHKRTMKFQDFIRNHIRDREVAILVIKYSTMLFQVLVAYVLF